MSHNAVQPKTATPTGRQITPDETRPLPLPDTKGWQKPSIDDYIVVPGVEGVWSFVQSYLCGTPKEFPEAGDHAFEAALLVPWGKRYAPVNDPQRKIAIVPWSALRLVLSWKEV